MEMRVAFSDCRAHEVIVRYFVVPTLVFITIYIWTVVFFLATCSPMQLYSHDL